jgi:hypothetical protein
MACHVCGAPTGKRAGQERRHIQSGIAYTGWGFTRIPTIDSWLSGSRRGPRRYYGLRTLCPDCAEKHDARLRHRRLALAILVVGGLIVLYLLFHKH